MTKLVFTCASERELPVEYIKSLGYPLVHAKNLLQQAKSLSRYSIIFLVTGCGKERSIRAAKDLISSCLPLAVVNLGTCGINACRKKIPGQIFFITETRTDIAGSIPICCNHLPFPVPDSIQMHKESLSTIEKPLLNRNDALLSLVDMEAGFQHIILEDAQVPFFSIKIATDLCNYDTPRAYKHALAHVRTMFKKLLTFLDKRSFTPMISAIIPVHNRHVEVTKAIESVRNQSYKPCETIVIDDASYPPLEESLARECLRDVRLIRVDKNSGVSFCRNLGISEAKGNWIALLDSDDQWKRHRLKNQIEYLKDNPFFEILQCEETWIRNGKRVNRCKHHDKEEGWLFEKGLTLCVISPSAVLFRKRVFEEFGGFDNAFPACEDYDLWLRISRHKPVGLNTQQDLIKYGGHPDQLSRTYEAMDRFRVIALLKALSMEKSKVCRERIIKVLQRKLTILLTGAIKRGKGLYTEIYNEIINKIDAGEEITWQDYQILLKKYL